MPRNPDKERCRALTRAGERCKKWAVRGGRLCHMHDAARVSARGGRRCRAVTATGKRCRKWALAGRTVCLQHDAGPRAGRRCRALTRAGEQCKKWALPGRTVCEKHDGAREKAPHDRRCRAMTARGKRCLKWATRASREAGRPRCYAHSGERGAPAEDVRCSALTRKGKRCRNWATLATRKSGRPLCEPHRTAEKPALPGIEADERRCQATTRAGTRCKKWVKAGTGLPLCWMHAYPDANPAIRHGFYRSRRTEAEAFVARRAEEAGTGPLAPEIAVLRLRIRRVLGYLNRPELTRQERLAALRLVLAGVRRVARLLRAQAALVAEEGEAEAGAGQG